MTNRPGEPARPSESSIATSAAVISMGNVTSRALGLLREVAISHYFGATGAVSAFRVASRTYNLLYELLVGGMLSSVLVPTLARVSGPHQERDFERVLGALIGNLGLLAALATGGLAVFAPELVSIMGKGFGRDLQELAASLMRTTAPAVFLMSLAGIVAAALYARAAFFWPSFMAAAFNCGIIAAVITLSKPLGLPALALGVVLGAAWQLCLQLAGARRVGFRLHPAWHYDPEVRQAFRLAAPVLLSLLVGQAQVVLDSYFASQTGERSLAWMASATTLVQLPLGLVATAVSLASLPELSRAWHGSNSHQETYGSVLGFSLRLVIVLILPATALLAVLAVPTVDLLFEHGQFARTDTFATARALMVYCLGLPFAAVDQCLILASYARADTLRPAAVGLAATGIYLAAAMGTMRRFGMLGLVLANSLQWLFHAVVMSWVTLRKHALPQEERVAIGRSCLRAVPSSAICATAAALVLAGLPTKPGLGWEALRLLLPGVTGAALYLLCMHALQSSEVRALESLALAKLCARR